MVPIADGPSAEQISEQLERILKSAEFAGPARLRRFLSYVVEERLAGREGKIKVYSITLNVLNRDESFDPQIDPIVHIEAGRLRRALERYCPWAARSGADRDPEGDARGADGDAGARLYIADLVHTCRGLTS